MSRFYNTILTLRTITFACWLVASAVFSDEFRFHRKADWDAWNFPRGAVVQNEDGSISLAWINKEINAALNSRDFEHFIRSSKNPIPGGIRHIYSNEEMADNLIDGRTETWWQPSQDDVIDDWWIEVDLGRMVYASKIRLIFPDTTDAVPFRNFSVYINTGERSNAAKDIFQFTRIGRTTEPNESRIIEYDLLTLDPGAATASGVPMVTGDSLFYAPVQYVRFVPEEHHPHAALAEVEVIALGDNVALGTIQRGGEIRAGSNNANASAFVDGDHNTNWTVSGGLDWADEGHYFEWDLGAVYWIDNMIVQIGAPVVYGGIANIRGYVISTSDGTEISGLTNDRVRSNFDYEQLARVNAIQSPVRDMYDFRYSARKTRHIFFHRDSNLTLNKVFYLVVEIGLFGEGYVAEAVMESDFIDLGGTKSIRRLTWDADLPPGTYVEIRSQTGDTFLIEKKYYNKNGIEVTEGQYNKLPKSQKRPIVEIQRRGSDWSGWSPIYPDQDGIFLSPSPRKYVQLQVKLGNENPEISPTLRNIALNFDDALVSGGVTSRILPRQVDFDSLQTFHYVLKPVFRSGDPGFDRVHIKTPGPVAEVAVKVGGERVLPTAVAMVGDSLRVDLPSRVRRDSVEVEFQARIQLNAISFDAWVGLAEDNLLQGVRPEADDAVTVFVPSVASGGSLIRNIEVSQLVTPNGDGINEAAAIAFALAKVEEQDVQPQVAIFDLSGRKVRELTVGGDGYAWDGRDEWGGILPPGSYICQIKMAADIGDEIVHRVINLAY